MGFSTVDVEGSEGAGPGGAVRLGRRVLGVEAFGIAGPDGVTTIAVGAPRGSSAPRGPFR